MNATCIKNFNVGHPTNFKDKLIVNLHLSFPVRSISRGIVIGIALTGNQSPLDVKTLSSLLKFSISLLAGSSVGMARDRNIGA